MKHFSDLLGKTLPSNDSFTFTLASGKKYKLYHGQDCCKSVHFDWQPKRDMLTSGAAYGVCPGKFDGK